MTSLSKIPAPNFGGLPLPFPVIEAALSGYSDGPMRRIARELGCPLAICEVFLDRFVLDVSKRSKARLYLAVRDEDHPSGAQLMGSEPEEFVAAAQRLVKFGFDLIDLNFACPVKKVLGRARGGSLLANPPRAIEIATAVRDALPPEIPVTVKLRKGFDDSPESGDRFWTILDGLLDRGIAGITLHGRTVREAYKGSADWNFVREVKRRLVEEKNRPDFFVYGSGDLFSPDESFRRLTEAGIDGLSLARGIIGYPWLFGEIAALWRGEPLPAPPTVFQQREVIQRHWNYSEALYGAKRAQTIMRKFLLNYALSHPESEKLRREFVLFRGQDRLGEIFDRYYSENRPGLRPTTRLCRLNNQGGFFTDFSEES